MIIRILGGNGAGKSHLVHSVLRQYPHKTTERDYILCERGGPLQNVAIPGHYRIANGGLDTMPGRLSYAYDLMAGWSRSGWHVLFEVSADADGAARTLELHSWGLPVRAILLTTPDEQRVSSVRTRGHSIRDDLIVRSGRKAERITSMLSAGGVPILVLDREGAYARVIAHLGGAS